MCILLYHHKSFKNQQILWEKNQYKAKINYKLHIQLLDPKKVVGGMEDNKIKTSKKDVIEGKRRKDSLLKHME